MKNSIRPYRPRLTIIGPSRAGKDTAAEYLVEEWGYTYGGSCSIYITQYLCDTFGLDFEETHSKRHENRDLYRALGDFLRRSDPAYFVRKSMKVGNICVGVRSEVEFEAGAAEGLLGYVLYIHKKGCIDTTFELSSTYAGLIVDNRGTKEDMYRELDRICTALGLHKKGA
jgi:hypothetical protein